jgi:hypothetical protein
MSSHSPQIAVTARVSAIVVIADRMENFGLDWDEEDSGCCQ